MFVYISAIKTLITIDEDALLSKLIFKVLVGESKLCLEVSAFFRINIKQMMQVMDLNVYTVFVSFCTTIVYVSKLSAKPFYLHFW